MSTLQCASSEKASPRNTLAAARNTDAFVAQALRHDGSTPAPGTTHTQAWIPIDAPVRGNPSNRNAHTYNEVLNPFAVGNNPRYTPRGGNTSCNIFVWDATRAMGAEIPHWVDDAGNPIGVGKGRELTHEQRAGLLPEGTGPSCFSASAPGGAARNYLQTSAHTAGFLVESVSEALKSAHACFSVSSEQSEALPRLYSLPSVHMSSYFSMVLHLRVSSILGWHSVALAP